MFLYKCLWVFFRKFWKLFPLQVIGTENVPLEGPLILAANHLSNWDPPFLGTYIDRTVSLMAKQELFEIPVFGSIIPYLFAFPVKRGAADRAAIKNALSQLKQGRCVGLFPEGTRSTNGKLGKPQAGVALLASLSQAPVVPVAIMGTNKIFQAGNYFPPLKIIYGKPLTIPPSSDKAALTEFSKQIMENIRAMQEEQGGTENAKTSS